MKTMYVLGIIYALHMLSIFVKLTFKIGLVIKVKYTFRQMTIRFYDQLISLAV